MTFLVLESPDRNDIYVNVDNILAFERLHDDMVTQINAASMEAGLTQQMVKIGSTLIRLVGNEQIVVGNLTKNIAEAMMNISCAITRPPTIAAVVQAQRASRKNKD